MRGSEQLRRRLALTATLGAAVLIAPAALPADAADPSSGTVTDSSTTVTWSAGPFATSNPTGAAGDPTCNAATVCDDYALHVSTPPGYGGGHQLAISIGWTNTAADFDLYVLDASGKIVGTSASSADPELVLLPPDSGDYTVRVVPYLPLGESFTGKAELTSTPPNPAPAGFAAPTYATYAAPETLPDAHNAGEPSIGVNPATGAVMYQSYVSTYKIGFDAANAASWADRSAKVTNGCPLGSTKSLDPILFTDQQTGRTFESQLAGKAALTCYTDDDGQTWNPTTGSGINSGVDHQTIGGGRFSDKALTGPVGSYKNAV
jgi:hypothetical protein